MATNPYWIRLRGTGDDDEEVTNQWITPDWSDDDSAVDPN